PHPFGSDFPLLCRLAQHLRRHAGAPVFFAVEAGKMLSDDLGRAITFDPLGAAVPGGDPALRIEHVNRAVGDRVDQQLELPLGLAQLLLQRLACRNIAKASNERGAAVERDRGNPQLDRELATAALQRRQLDPPPEIIFLAGIEKAPEPAGMSLAIALG